MRISDWSSDVCSSDLKLIRAKRKYSSELNARQEEIYALQEHLRKMEGDNLVSLTEIKDINRRMNVGEAKARRAKKEMVEANLRLEIGRASCRERVGQ